MTISPLYCTTLAWSAYQIEPRAENCRCSNINRWEAFLKCILARRANATPRKATHVPCPQSTTTNSFAGAGKKFSFACRSHTGRRAELINTAAGILESCLAALFAHRSSVGNSHEPTTSILGNKSHMLTTSSLSNGKARRAVGSADRTVLFDLRAVSSTFFLLPYSKKTLSPNLVLQC
jgi:hypothetical protein